MYSHGEPLTLWTIHPHSMIDNGLHRSACRPTTISSSFTASWNQTSRMTTGRRCTRATDRRDRAGRAGLGYMRRARKRMDRVLRFCEHILPDTSKLLLCLQIRLSLRNPATPSAFPRGSWVRRLQRRWTIRRHSLLRPTGFPDTVCVLIQVHTSPKMDGSIGIPILARAQRLQMDGLFDFEDADLSLKRNDCITAGEDYRSGDSPSIERDMELRQPPV